MANERTVEPIMRNSGNGSLNLGRYSGIPVRAHWSMALVAVFFGVNFAAQFGVASGIIATAAFFASILFHEFGHALVARRFGVNTESIELWALGGVARLDRESPTPKADGLIAVAGPAVSLALGVAALAGAVALESSVLLSIGDAREIFSTHAVIVVLSIPSGVPCNTVHNDENEQCKVNM